MLIGVVAEEGLISSAIVGSMIMREDANALDFVNAGFDVPSLLVDDPASAGDFIDAYLGQIMLEATSAGDVVDALISATGIFTVIEATTAADAPDAAILSYATFDGVPSNVTLSN